MRFARAMITVGAQDDVVACRQLWGQLFLQANLRGGDVDSIAHQVGQLEIHEEYEQVMNYLMSTEHGPFQLAMTHPITTQEWKHLIMFLNTHVIALRHYNSSESESDLLDKYIADTTADTTTTPIMDQPSEEIDENPTSGMDEDNTPSDEEENESQAQEEDVDMDKDETSSVTEEDEEKDPAASLLGSKWAPEDQAVVMKVDDPAEMLNLSYT